MYALYLRYKSKLWHLVFWPVLLWFSFYATLSVAALTPEQNLALSEGAYYFNTEDASYCGTVVAAPVGGSSISPTQNQITNAKIVMGIAKTENLGQQGALIGLMVGLAESALLILANPNVPVSESNPAKQGDGSDHDSVGIYQQRPSMSWSTLAPDGGTAALSNKDAVWQLMDPAYAAEAFFGSPPGSNAPGPLSKGLQNKSGWQSMDPWLAAQAVQASGDSTGMNYKAQMGQAQNLISRYWNDAPAVPLPVPLSGGTASGSGATIGTGCSDATNSSVTQAVIQAGLDEIKKNIPYVFGAGGPNGPSGNPAGFDCSSFMQYVFYQGAHITLPRTAGDQYNATVGQGHSVQMNAIQPGDMLFYGSSPGNIGHVVMYIGDNKIMEAPHEGLNILVTTLYTQAAPGETLQGIGYYPPVGG